MNILPPIPLFQWIEKNKDQLRPPVGNKVVYEDGEFVVMIVGGPNNRTDFHYNEGPEFFYQLQGDMILRIRENDKTKEIPLRAGEIFLLPGKVPHSPQRPAGTVGLVIERKRTEKEKDGFFWYCTQCDRELYSEFVSVTNFVTQLPPLFERYYSRKENTTCKHCGQTHAQN